MNSDRDGDKHEEEEGNEGNLSGNDAPSSSDGTTNDGGKAGRNSNQINNYEIYVGIVGLAPAALGALGFWLSRFHKRCCCAGKVYKEHSSSNLAAGSTDSPRTSSTSHSPSTIVPVEVRRTEPNAHAKLIQIPGFSEKQLRKLRYLVAKNDLKASHAEFDAADFLRNNIKNMIRKRRVYSIEYPRQNLQLDDIIGEGNFGQVWRAKAINMKAASSNNPNNNNNNNGANETASNSKQQPVIVAVKTNKLDSDERDAADLLQELDVMLQLSQQHPNVIRILGCCTEAGE